MEKQIWSGGALLAPVPPVLVTCGTMAKPNILTVGWTGIINTVPAKTYISIRPERYSYSMIRESGEFVINLPTADMARAVDFCGVRSGRQTDKFAANGLIPQPAAEVVCPILAQSPLSLECRIFEQMDLGSHTMFLADIIAVDVQSDLIDSAGKLHLDRAGLLAYAHGEYFALGKKLGSFGFSVRKKPHTCVSGSRARVKSTPDPRKTAPSGINKNPLKKSGKKRPKA